MPAGENGPEPLSLSPSLSLSLPRLVPLLLRRMTFRIINYLIKPRALEAREGSGKKIFAPFAKQTGARGTDRGNCEESRGWSAEGGGVG